MLIVQAVSKDNEEKWAKDEVVEVCPIYVSNCRQLSPDIKKATASLSLLPMNKVQELVSLGKEPLWRKVKESAHSPGVLFITCYVDDEMNLSLCVNTQRVSQVKT